MTGMADFTRVRPETLDMLRRRADAGNMSVDELLERAIVAYDHGVRPGAGKVVKTGGSVENNTLNSRRSMPEFIDFLSDQDHAIILNNKPDEYFLHAGVIGVYINNVRTSADSWGTVIQDMCDQVARTHRLHGNDLVRFLKTNIRGFRVSAGRITQNGYKYNPKLDISVQVMSTAKNASSALDMARLSKVHLSIFVRWRPGAGQALRGQLGLVGEKLTKY